MKKKTDNVWGVLYPILYYYAISSFVFFALNILFGEAQEIYMLKQMLSSASTIPFLVSLWKQDKYAEDVVYGKQKQSIGQNLRQGILVCIGMAALGAALNNFIAMTPLVEFSAGFQNANEHFFAGEFLFEVLASCIVVPIAEEVLFRGIILKRISMMASENLGIVFSAVLFGIIHVNLVQFLYATLLGILLAFIVVKTRRVSLAVLGHGAANFIAVLRAETGILDFSYQANPAGIVFSLAAAAIGGFAVWLLVKQGKEKVS